MRITMLAALAAAIYTPMAFANTGLATIISDPITVIFIAVNIGLTYYFTRVRFNKFSIQHGPEILTTVGICGCFLGIAMALLDFDANKVSTSVPFLLNGVKTAFWASLSGVVGSLVIRWRHHAENKRTSAITPEQIKDATLTDVISAINGLQKSLAGQEDGSLLSQFKLMRQEQNDQLVTLRSSFDAFADKMAADGSKALIDALREVIQDFNAKISEQFGENFKQLNQAVEKLVIWQAQYRDELDKMQAVQQNIAIDLQQSAQGMSVIAQRTDSFTEAAVNLEQLIRSLAQQYSAIEQSQKSLADVLGTMKDVTPMFSDKLDLLADSMRQGTAKMQTETADMVRNYGLQMQSASSEMKQMLTDTLKSAQQQVNDEMKKGLDTVHQGVIALDKGLQEELTKSLESLGRQLASLSEKFVADYTPLTDKLRDVVNIARVQ
jgi:ABC-type transporter Mla subunit MlaD